MADTGSKKDYVVVLHGIARTWRSMRRLARYIERNGTGQIRLNRGSPTAMFDKIAFVHYETENLDRALKFYRDVLGLTLRVQNGEWIEFDVGGQRLALRQVDPRPHNQDASRPSGAMVWLEARPIESAIAHLKKK